MTEGSALFYLAIMGTAIAGGIIGSVIWFFIEMVWLAIRDNERRG